MAGTITVTPSNVGFNSNAVRTEISWVADGSGAVSASSVMLPAGTILSVEFVPSATVPPDNDYTVDLQTPAGVSLLSDGSGGSIGSSLSGSSANILEPFINGATTTYVRTWIAGGPNYNFIVSAAGAGGQGKVIVFVSPMGI